jgi:hypothetical protein
VAAIPPSFFTLGLSPDEYDHEKHGVEHCKVLFFFTMKVLMADGEDSLECAFVHWFDDLAESRPDAPRLHPGNFPTLVMQCQTNCLSFMSCIGKCLIAINVSLWTFMFIYIYKCPFMSLYSESVPGRPQEPGDLGGFGLSEGV